MAAACFFVLLFGNGCAAYVAGVAASVGVTVIDSKIQDNPSENWRSTDANAQPSSPYSAARQAARGPVQLELAARSVNARLYAARPSFLVCLMVTSFVATTPNAEKFARFGLQEISLRLSDGSHIQPSGYGVRSECPLGGADLAADFAAVKAEPLRLVGTGTVELRLPAETQKAEWLLLQFDSIRPAPGEKFRLLLGPISFGKRQFNPLPMEFKQCMGGDC